MKPPRSEFLTTLACRLSRLERPQPGTLLPCILCLWLALLVLWIFVKSNPL